MKKINTIFLLAMNYEVVNIFNMSEWVKIETKPFVIYEHKLVKCIIIETGVGKVNAAAASEFVLKFNAKHYYNLGLAGSFDNSVVIGSVSQIEKTIFWDVDVTALDFKLGQIPFNGLESYQLSVIPFSDTPQTNCISGDSFVSDVVKVSTFATDFSATLLDMEIASIAHVFHLHSQLNKLYSLKAVSDYLNNDSADDFYDKKEMTFNKLSLVAAKIVKSII